MCLRGHLGASVSVYLPVRSGHLNQLTRRLAPKRHREKGRASPAAELLELAADPCLGFPKLVREQGPLSEQGPIVPVPREEDNLTQGGGVEQIQFSQSIRKMMPY